MNAADTHSEPPHQPEDSPTTEDDARAESELDQHHQTTRYSSTEAERAPDVDSDPQQGEPTTKEESPPDEGTTGDWSSEGGATEAGPATDTPGKHPHED